MRCTNYSKESSEGMSDEMIDTCMRSFDLAITRATYINSIKLDIEAATKAWEAAKEEILYELDDDFTADHPSCGVSRKPFALDMNDLETTLSGGADMDNKTDILLHSPENDNDSLDTFINLESPYVWRTEPSEDARLHDCMIAFDFLISRLVPKDSPELPTRILPFLEPGCPDCFFDEAHPLPKYDQYCHDLRDFGALLRSRVGECSTLTRELIGHPDRVLASEAHDGWGDIYTKILNIAFETEWPKVEDSNPDVDYEGLGVLFQEAHEREKEDFRSMPDDQWSNL
ncbi:MAG: hypothetical protein Q9209_006841 [Squamulea sp. 1 TL-2023]